MEKEIKGSEGKFLPEKKLGVSECVHLVHSLIPLKVLTYLGLGWSISLKA